jgi:MYXO-CTERM domain-containing protein
MEEGSGFGVGAALLAFVLLTVLGARRRED